MHTITFFSPKGGAGRTTCTMALASGFLAQGKRVTVMDCTCSNGFTSSLEALATWMAKMAECGFQAPRLERILCDTPEDVSDKIATAKSSGVDIVLIDTSAIIGDTQQEAFDRADLIVAPATGLLEADVIIRRLSDVLDMPEHLIGLVTGLRSGSKGAADTRKAFSELPVFHFELPHLEALADQSVLGHIADIVSDLRRKPGEAGYARFREAEAAWVALQQLTVEVQVALEGLRFGPWKSVFEQRQIPHLVQM